MFTSKGARLRVGGDSEVVEEAGVGVASSLVSEAVTGMNSDPTVVCETLVKAEVTVVLEAIEVTTEPKSSDNDIKSPLDGPLVPAKKGFTIRLDKSRQV